MDNVNESFIFKLQDGEVHSGRIDHWGKSKIYDADRISAIKSQDIAKTVASLSTPTPFARMDLARIAFANVAKDLDGAPMVYQKIVSDTLDVAEIFFNYDKLKGKVEIIVWDSETDLRTMVQNQPTAGKALKKFMKVDAQSFHFDKMKRLYILNYIGEDAPKQINVIGATSPVSLFFSAANEENEKGDNLSFVSPHIHFGQDMPFDQEFQPLYKRDGVFVKYLYAFQKSVEGFASLFPEVDSYLETCFQCLDHKLKSEILAQTAVSINDYDRLEFGRNYVEILGYPFHKKPDGKPHSDFEIVSSVCTGVKPLVLPVESGKKYANLIYTQSPWGTQYKAPFYDPKDPSQRVLPFEDTKYPYLTISDFLTVAIVKMPYPMNSNAFYDGDMTTDDFCSHLLPVSKTFFDYFTVNDLMGDVDIAEGERKKMFEMRRLVTGVEVIMRIPIKKGCIEYHRNYFENITGNQKDNTGEVVEKSFGLGVFPMVRCENPHLSYYRIALFDSTKDDLSLAFFDGNHFVPSDKVVRRKRGENCSVETYVVEHSHFDRIVVNDRGRQCVAIPKFKKEAGEAKFVFAVDFGTTNTYIEYSIDGNPSVAFDILDSDCQMQRLHLDYMAAKDIRDSFDNNFVPQSIYEGSDYEFPIRTVFVEHENIDYTDEVFTLASGNIPFKYEKDVVPTYNVVRTDLKWSSDSSVRIKLFIENLVFMMRNKVLLNGGRLSNTKLVWFYPSSMNETQRNNLQNIWSALYDKYFGYYSANNVIPMSESTAPYCYYSKKKGAKSNAVTIDIGGETTDIYVVENRIPVMLTSFRFASNAVFGDGYSWDSDNNGFVNLYKNELKTILQEYDLNHFGNLGNAFMSILAKKRSSDIIAFFFSLANNKQVAGAIPFDFMKKMSDNKQIKYVFIVFYASIIYHVACAMKSKGLQMPSTIAFSGNGARTLEILSKTPKVLEDFISKIFGKVYGDESACIDVIVESQPKKATCKGGILRTEDRALFLREDIKYDLLGCDKTKSLQGLSLEEIDETIRNQIVKEIIGFITFVKQLNKDDYYQKLFGADKSVEKQIDKVFVAKKIYEYLKDGIDKKVKECAGVANDPIDETLFFYPMIGLLNELVREISKPKEE